MLPLRLFLLLQGPLFLATYCLVIPSSGICSCFGLVVLSVPLIVLCLSAGLGLFCFLLYDCFRASFGLPLRLFKGLSAWRTWTPTILHRLLLRYLPPKPSAIFWPRFQRRGLLKLRSLSKSWMTFLRSHCLVRVLFRWPSIWLIVLSLASSLASSPRPNPLRSRLPRTGLPSL